MKKNLKNGKVIKAITIGLSAMMAASSTPIVAFAEEAPADKSDEQKATEVTGFSSEVKEEVESLSSIDENKTEIETAQNEVAVADTAIQAAESDVKVAIENENDSDASFTEYRKNIVEAEKKADAVDAKVEETENILQDKSEAIEEATTVEQVDQLVNEATEALEEAKAECEALENEYETAKKAYEEAIENMKTADAEAAKAYASAMENYKNASEKLAEAQQNLVDAEKLAKEAKEAAEAKQSELSGLVEQIYAQLGIVSDTQKELQNLKENNPNSYKNKQNNIWSVNDALAPLLVKYDFYANNICDPGSVTFSTYIKNKKETKSNYIVVSYTVDGESQFKFFDYLPVDKEGNTTSGTDGAVDNLYQIRVVEKSVENLKYNNFVVTSIDSVNADGTLNITYVKKNGKGQDVEVKASKVQPIFDSKGDGDITPDGIKHSVTELEQIIKNAQDAETDVANAIARVDELKEAVDSIELNNQENGLAGKEQALSILKSQLELAQKKYEDALGKKADLDEQLAQLEVKAGNKKDAIIAAARRNNRDEADAVPADLAADSPVFIAAPQANAEIAGAVGGINNVNAGAVDEENAAADEALIMDLGNGAGEILNLDDEATPLASFADEDFELGGVKNVSWMWGIIIAIFGAAGFEFYKKSQKRKLLLAAKKKKEDEEA